MLRFGIQSTQIHLNYWNEDNYKNFEKFILKNHSKIINFEKCIEKVNNNFLSKFINLSTKVTIRSLRLLTKT